MKLEKRSGDRPTEPAENVPPTDTDKKPVVIYIMVLFIAAFLLMIWSLFSHQRSNTEALGRLQSSGTAMQAVQELQDQVIALQRELAEANKRLEELEDTSSVQQKTVEILEMQNEAMQRLYMLQQQYAAGNYDACCQILHEFDTDGYTKYLPHLSDESVTHPEDRYQQLKDAVELHEAEAAAKEDGIS